MKTISWKAIFPLVFATFALTSIVKAQDSKEERLIDDSKNAKAEFIKTDELSKKTFNDAYGYAIFPNVGKGAVGVGGGAGSGIVYENGKMVGSARMTQLTVGAQIGGQAFREVIFFENKAAMDRFKEGKFEFTAQTSAVVMTAGVSANAKYNDGVMVFTQAKAGLMTEASVGGQKFSYNPF